MATPPNGSMDAAAAPARTPDAGGGVSYEPLVVPATADAPDAADFAAMAGIFNDNDAGVLGTADMDWRAEEILPYWHDPLLHRRGIVAWCDGAIVGCATYELPAADADEGWITIGVASGYRGRGIGAGLFTRIMDVTREQGHTVVQTYFLTAADTTGRVPSGARLHCPTGFGWIPREDPGARFALARGFTLEQVERVSRLALPVDAALLERAVAGASAVAGADYALESWEGPTPPRWLADIADLRTGMSTDAPFGGIDVTEDTWDAERVATADEREATSTARTLVSAAVHVASGRVVGYSMLKVPALRGAAVSQDATIVQRSHRGHRLGMLMKAANLVLLEAAYPGHPAVITGNAEQNRHMLAVNEALGFVAIGYEGEWKRKL